MDGSVTQNVLNNIAPWWDAIMVIAYLVGFGTVISGLYKLAHAAQGTYGRSSAGGIGAGMTPIFFGSLMLALPTMMSIMTTTLFNAPAPSSALSYAPPGDSTTGNEIRFVVMVLHLVGVYAIIKGLYMLATMAEGRGGEFNSAMWHLVGGAIALRIDLFMKALGMTVGGVMQSVVGKLFSGS